MTVQGVYLFSDKHARKILSVLVECTHSIACTQEIPLSAAMLAINIVFTPICTAVVSLRIWVRLTSRCFGLEDWLMCIGAVSLKWFDAR
jgi:uncharacterized membrane protein HdeD (DUF308 family)